MIRAAPAVFECAGPGGDLRPFSRCSVRRYISLQGRTPKRFPADLVGPARRRLAQLHAAATIEDLRFPPGNRLHPLNGDRAGQWSISVNDQFRVCFEWGEHGPENVEFVDYH